MNEMQPTRHHGSCLCGAVRFVIEGGFDHFYLCHCAHCRKDTGSAYAANLFSATATLRWLAGEDKAILYRLPATRHARCFCDNCGSGLPYAMEQMIVVPAGSLDAPFDAVPDAHIFVASKAAWEHDLDRLPAFDAFPS